MRRQVRGSPGCDRLLRFVQTKKMCENGEKAASRRSLLAQNCPPAAPPPHRGITGGGRVRREYRAVGNLRRNPSHPPGDVALRAVNTDGAAIRVMPRCDARRMRAVAAAPQIRREKTQAAGFSYNQ